MPAGDLSAPEYLLYQDNDERAVSAKSMPVVLKEGSMLPNQRTDDAQDNPMEMDRNAVSFYTPIFH